MSDISEVLEESLPNTTYGEPRRMAEESLEDFERSGNRAVYLSILGVCVEKYFN